MVCHRFSRMREPKAYIYEATNQSSYYEKRKKNEWMKEWSPNLYRLARGVSKWSHEEWEERMLLSDWLMKHQLFAIRTWYCWHRRSSTHLRIWWNEAYMISGSICLLGFKLEGLLFTNDDFFGPRRIQVLLFSPSCTQHPHPPHLRISSWGGNRDRDDFPYSCCCSFCPSCTFLNRPRLDTCRGYEGTGVRHNDIGLLKKGSRSQREF